MQKTKEEILKKNGLQIGFKSTYSWDAILKSMDEFVLQFEDDNGRANYYEDKIDILKRIIDANRNYFTEQQLKNAFNAGLKRGATKKGELFEEFVKYMHI